MQLFWICICLVYGKRCVIILFSMSFEPLHVKSFTIKFDSIMNIFLPSIFSEYFVVNTCFKSVDSAT